VETKSLSEELGVGAEALAPLLQRADAHNGREDAGERSSALFPRALLKVEHTDDGRMVRGRSHLAASGR
jgi:hypothetical protein